MTASEKVRQMLDERRVEYTQTTTVDGILFNVVTRDEHYFILVRNNGTGIEVWSRDLTPEQAIAATLGPGTCKPVEQYLDLHSDLTDDEMKAYAVSLAALNNVGVTATPEQIMAVAAKLGPRTCNKIRVHMPIEDEMHCSECGRFLGFAGDVDAPPYNFCPNCGAKVVDAEVDG